MPYFAEHCSQGVLKSWGSNCRLPGAGLTCELQLLRERVGSGFRVLALKGMEMKMDNYYAWGL